MEPAAAVRLRRRPVSERRNKLEDLYLAEGAGASRLAVLLTKDRNAAEDIVQEAFARVARRFFVLRSDEHARAYLYRTVMNLCHTRGRQIKRDQQLAHRTRAKHDAIQVDPPEDDEIWHALRTLPIRQRTAMFLRYYLDQSEAQAADTLQCSPSALKSLVNRALITLRAELQGEDHG